MRSLTVAQVSRSSRLHALRLDYFRWLCRAQEIDQRLRGGNGHPSIHFSLEKNLSGSVCFMVCFTLEPLDLFDQLDEPNGEQDGLTHRCVLTGSEDAARHRVDSMRVHFDPRRIFSASRSETFSSNFAALRRIDACCRHTSEQ